MTKMTKTEKIEFATLIANAVVEALKATSTNSQLVENGRKSANEAPSSEIQKKTNEATSSKKTASSKKLTIADFEPKGSKCKEGYTNWNSYSSQRTKYCYYVATNGDITDGDVFGTKWYKKVDFSENSKYYKAKEKFEAKYHYVKKADR